MAENTTYSESTAKDFSSKFALLLCCSTRRSRSCWYAIIVFASLFAALVAVSAQVIPPSQNSATSASENVNTAHYYNQNFYARDESSIRLHSSTFGNNAKGYYPWQHALPVSHTLGTADVPFLNPAIEGPPVYFVDPTLLQPQDQVHKLATSNLRSHTAAANPFFASSDTGTDSTAHSKEVLYVAQPIVF